MICNAFDRAQNVGFERGMDTWVRKVCISLFCYVNKPAILEIKTVMTSQLSHARWLNNNVTDRSRSRYHRMTINRVLNTSPSTPPISSSRGHVSHELTERDIAEHDAFSLARCAPYTKRMKAKPNPLNVRTQNVNHSDATRIQCLALFENGTSAKQAEIICGVGGKKANGQTVQRWLRKAKSLGYDRNVSRVIKAEYVQDRSRNG